MSYMLAHTAELSDIAVAFALSSSCLDVELLLHSSEMGNSADNRCLQQVDVCIQCCCFADQMTLRDWQYTESRRRAEHQTYDPYSLGRESAARRAGLLGRRDMTVL